jgi:hypothetical protein
MQVGWQAQVWIAFEKIKSSPGQFVRACRLIKILNSNADRMGAFGLPQICDDSNNWRQMKPCWLTGLALDGVILPVKCIALASQPMGGCCQEQYLE